MRNKKRLRNLSFLTIQELKRRLFDSEEYIETLENAVARELLRQKDEAYIGRLQNALVLERIRQKELAGNMRKRGEKGYE